MTTSARWGTGRRRIARVPLRRLLLAAAAAIVLAVGVGGAQAAGGELDPSFGNGGIVSSFGGGAFLAVAVQADGKIVAAGRSGNAAGGTDCALARYTTGGKLDGSFGAGGKVLTDLGGNCDAHGVAIQQDGMIVAAGVSAGGFMLARYTK